MKRNKLSRSRNVNNPPTLFRGANSALQIEASINAMDLVGNLCGVLKHIEQRMQEKQYVRTEQYIFLFWLVVRMGPKNAADTAQSMLGQTIDLAWLQLTLLERIPYEVHQRVFEALQGFHRSGCQMPEFDDPSGLVFNECGGDPKPTEFQLCFLKRMSRFCPSLPLNTFLGCEVPYEVTPEISNTEPELRDYIGMHDMVRFFCAFYTSPPQHMAAFSQLQGLVTIMPLYDAFLPNTDASVLFERLVQEALRISENFQAGLIPIEDMGEELYRDFDDMFRYISSKINLKNYKEKSLVTVLSYIDFVCQLYPYLSKENRQAIEANSYIIKEFLNFIRKNPKLLSRIPSHCFSKRLTELHRRENKYFLMAASGEGTSSAASSASSSVLTDKQREAIIEELLREEALKEERVPQAQKQRKINTKASNRRKQFSNSSVPVTDDRGLTEAASNRLQKAEERASAFVRRSDYFNFLNAYITAFQYTRNQETLAKFTRDTCKEPRAFEALIQESKQILLELLGNTVQSDLVDDAKLVFNLLSYVWGGIQFSSRLLSLAKHGAGALLELPKIADSKNQKRRQNKKNKRGGNTIPLNVSKHEAIPYKESMDALKLDDKKVMEKVMESEQFNLANSEVSLSDVASVSSESQNSQTSYLSSQLTIDEDAAVKVYRIAGHETEFGAYFHLDLSMRYLLVEPGFSIAIAPAGYVSRKPMNGFALFGGVLDHRTGAFLASSIKTFECSEQAMAQHGMYFPLNEILPIYSATTPLASYYDYLTHQYRWVNYDVDCEMKQLLTMAKTIPYLIYQACFIAYRLGVPLEIVQAWQYVDLPFSLANFYLRGLFSESVRDNRLIFSILSTMDYFTAFELINDFMGEQSSHYPFLTHRFEKDFEWTIFPQTIRPSSDASVSNEARLPIGMSAQDLLEILDENSRTILKDILLKHAYKSDCHPDVYLKEHCSIKEALWYFPLLSKTIGLFDFISVSLHVMRSFPDCFLDSNRDDRFEITTSFSMDKKLPVAAVNFGLNLLKNNIGNDRLAIEPVWELYDPEQIMTIVQFIKRLVDANVTGKARPIHIAIPVMLEHHFLLTISFLEGKIEMRWFDPKLSYAMVERLFPIVQFALSLLTDVPEEAIVCKLGLEICQALNDDVYGETAVFSQIVYWVSFMQHPDATLRNLELPKHVCTTEEMLHVPVGCSYETYLTRDQRKLRESHVALVNSGSLSPEEQTFRLRAFMDRVNKPMPKPVFSLAKPEDAEGPSARNKASPMF